MATIRKRGGRWQVQVRRKGYGAVNRSFIRQADAKTWARQMEAAADRRELPADPVSLDDMTLADLLHRYRDTVTSRKRGASVERYRLNAVLRHKVAKVPLSRLSAADFAAYRDQRLRAAGTGTLNRELALLRHCCSVARSEWGIPLNGNPLDHVRKPKVPPARERRLGDGEETLRLNAAARSRNKQMEPLIRLAIETAMRRGELLKIHWQDIDWERRTLNIPMTKNGHPRTIPLTTEAIAVLRELRANNHSAVAVFAMSVNAARLAWQRLIRRTDIENLHFHDLRHEAISRFFERGLSNADTDVPIRAERAPRAAISRSCCVKFRPGRFQWLASLSPIQTK